MSKALQQLLGQINTIGSIKTVQTGLPLVVPPAFLTASRKVAGRTVEYKKVIGRRDNGKMNNYGSPANQVQQTGLSSVTVNLCHAFDVMNHDPIVLQNLLGVNGEAAQGVSVAEVVRQQVEYLARFENKRTSALYSALVNGKIWLSSTGDIQFSSSGAAVTIDYSVPAANQNQIDSIIGTTWATDTVDVIGDIQAIKKKAVQTSGLPLKYAFYGANIAEYIGSNTVCANYIRGTPSLSAQAYASGEIPNGFCGLQWVPAYLAFGLDTAAGTDAVTDWFGGDTVVFTPEVNAEWYEMVEGGYVIPNGLGTVSNDASSAASQFTAVTGMFQYATVSHNPPGIGHFAGDTFLPLIKNGAAIFIADVVP